MLTCDEQLSAASQKLALANAGTAISAQAHALVKPWNATSIDELQLARLSRFSKFWCDASYACKLSLLGSLQLKLT